MRGRRWAESSLFRTTTTFSKILKVSRYVNRGRKLVLKEFDLPVRRMLAVGGEMEERVLEMRG